MVQSQAGSAPRPPSDTRVSQPVSQLGQSAFTNALDNDRGLDCNLVYQTWEEAARVMDFYPLDSKEQISKKRAKNTLV